jgi:hypothetical protein
MGSEILRSFSKEADFLCINLLCRRRRITTRIRTARRIVAAPTAMPIMAPRETLAADEDDFPSAAAVAAALLVLVLEDEVVDEDELLDCVVEKVVVGAALVTKVVGDC